jgi:hypothetical protein
MRFIDSGVSVEARIDHDPVDEVIYNRRNAIYTPQPIVKTESTLVSHVEYLLPCEIGVMARLTLRQCRGLSSIPIGEPPTSARR